MRGSKWSLVIIAILLFNIVTVIGKVYADTVTYTLTLEQPVISLNLQANPNQSKVPSAVVSTTFQDTMSIDTTGSNTAIMLKAKVDSVSPGLTLLTSDIIPQANQVLVRINNMAMKTTDQNLTTTPLAVGTKTSYPVGISFGAGTAYGVYTISISVTGYVQ